MSTPVPQVMLEYIDGLKNHDVNKVATTTDDKLHFISATRILDKQQFLAMLAALYAGFPDWNYEFKNIEDRGQGNYAVKWYQGGTHTGVWTMPGMSPLQPTGKSVRIPPHYFFYRVANEKLTIIFPEPVPGGAPLGIIQQIGARSGPL